jgi:hypothetical protein
MIPVSAAQRLRTVSSPAPIGRRAHGRKRGTGPRGRDIETVGGRAARTPLDLHDATGASCDRPIADPTTGIRGVPTSPDHPRTPPTDGLAA